MHLHLLLAVSLQKRNCNISSGANLSFFYFVVVFVAMVIPAFLAPVIGHISDKVKYLKEEEKLYLYLIIIIFGCTIRLVDNLSLHVV